MGFLHEYQYKDGKNVVIELDIDCDRLSAHMLKHIEQNAW